MSENKPVAVLGNFTDPDSLTSAAKKIRDAGYTDFDIYTPYPVHGLDKAQGLKRSILSYISFGGTLAGFGAAQHLIWFTGAFDYKLNIGGKPFYSLPFSIPVTFELTVLLTAFATFFGVFFLCGLPKWHHPLQNDPGFQRAVDDTFVVSIFSSDHRFSLDITQKFMSELGGGDVRVVYN